MSGVIKHVKWRIDTFLRTLTLECPCGFEADMVLPDCVESPCPTSVSRPETFKRVVLDWLREHDPCGIPGAL